MVQTDIKLFCISHFTSELNLTTNSSVTRHNMLLTRHLLFRIVAVLIRNRSAPCYVIYLCNYSHVSQHFQLMKETYQLLRYYPKYNDEPIKHVSAP